MISELNNPRVSKKIVVKFYNELTRQDIEGVGKSMAAVLDYFDLEWHDGVPYRVSNTAKAVL